MKLGRSGWLDRCVGGWRRSGKGWVGLGRGERGTVARWRQREKKTVWGGRGGEPQSYIHDQIERMSVCVGGICWGWG